MAEEGLLKKNFFSRELGCPTNGSINVTIRQYCQKCDSTNFSKEEIIEDLVSGYVGPESEFKDGKSPKTSKPLKKLGVDYIKHGKQYVCKDCKDIFQKPRQKLVCATDGTVFDPQDAKEVILYSYTASKKLEEETNKALYQQKYISDELRELDFAVESPATLKGKSGINQQFYMVAHTGFSFLRTNVVIELLGNAEVSEEGVFLAYNKATDVGANGLVIAAVPKLSQNAKKVAQTYGITFIEAPDIPTASEKIVSKFKELMTTPAEEVLKMKQ